MADLEKYCHVKFFPPFAFSASLICSEEFYTPRSYLRLTDCVFYSVLVCYTPDFFE